MAHALYITTFTKKDSIWAEFGFGQKFRSFFSSIFWATKEFWANVSVTLFTLNVWRQLFGSSYSDVFMLANLFLKKGSICVKSSCHVQGCIGLWPQSIQRLLQLPRSTSIASTAR